ncbi:MAG: TetR/AcrR family transcriptional regulator [Oscillospiraceae bacterium]|nr:TetR/AcrR family transcriptional regulator [Oscillospiraceae bacterium]MCI1991221.1 TetR/AcrR family transcriptional regulator [Oscillospiraceae bacterium]MCI2035609.1 TetR/AcrR family transcriptional regulator [Oscillospiraceae bacterium]
MEREERKAEYLEHFADAFAEHGIDKTSIKKLAGAAEINEASIYQYFENKDEIIVELVKRYFESMKKEILPILTDEKYPPELRLQRLMNYRFKTKPRSKFVIQVLTSPTYGEICLPEIRNFLASVHEMGAWLSRRMDLPEEVAKSYVMVFYSVLVADRIFNCKSILSEELEFLRLPGSLGAHARFASEENASAY